MWLEILSGDCYKNAKLSKTSESCLSNNGKKPASETLECENPKCPPIHTSVVGVRKVDHFLWRHSRLRRESWSTIYIYNINQHDATYAVQCLTWSSETAKCGNPQTVRIHRGFCWCHVVRCSDLTRLNKLLQQCVSRHPARLTCQWVEKVSQNNVRSSPACWSCSEQIEQSPCHTPSQGGYAATCNLLHVTEMLWD